MVRIGVPLLDGRVAPRCTSANRILLVEVTSTGSVTSRVVDLPVGTPEELLELAQLYRITTFVCDGLTRESRSILLTHGLRVVENVVGSAQEVVQAVTGGALRSGFGLLTRRDGPPQPKGE